MTRARLGRQRGTTCTGAREALRAREPSRRHTHRSRRGTVQFRDEAPARPAGESSPRLPLERVRRVVSDSHPSSESEGERSSGEELLEREERVKEADRRARANRSERPADSGAEAEAAAEEDAEDVESEWHTWALAALVVAGLAMVFAPPFLVPELLGSLGVFFVLIGVLGWAVAWVIRRSA